MTPPDTNYVGVKEYAAHQGVTERTVRRYLEAGRLPGAWQDDANGGRWWIPLADPVHLDTAPVPRAQGADVAAAPDTTRDTSRDMVATGGQLQPLQVGPLGMLGTLEEAAAVLGTTVGGVRRLADAGHLTVGRFGPNGALRVYLPGR